MSLFSKLAPVQYREYKDHTYIRLSEKGKGLCSLWAPALHGAPFFLSKINRNLNDSPPPKKKNKKNRPNRKLWSTFGSATNILDTVDWQWLTIKA